MKVLRLGHWKEVPDRFTGKVIITEDINNGVGWYLNGEEHRVEGPSTIFDSGDKRWYLKGECLTKEEHSEETKYRNTTLGKLIWREKELSND